MKRGFTAFRKLFGQGLIALLLVLPLSALAEPPLSLRFERLALGPTLENSEIAAMLQDRQGFIWLATNNGLARFDGYQLVTYRNDPANPRSLPVTALALFEDRQGRLWVGGWGGLARLDAGDGGFTHFAPDAASRGRLNIWKMIGDGRGGMWIATTYGGLLHFDPDSGRFTVYRHDPANPASIASDNISALELDDKGGLWIAAWPGSMDYLAPGGAIFQHFPLGDSHAKISSADSVRALRFDRQQRLWIGTGSGIFTWRPAHETWASRRRMPLPPSVDVTWVNHIEEDRDGILWVGTRASGLLRWYEQKQKQKFLVYRSNAQNPHSLQGNYIKSLMQDREGSLWIGGPYGGLSKVNLAIRGIEKLRPSELGPGVTQSSDIVTCLAGDSQGRVWLAGGKGLHLLDTRARKILRSYYRDPQRADSLSNDRVDSLYLTPEGELWLGTPSGLNRFDPVSGRFTVVRFGDAASDFISAVSPGRGGLLWLGTAGGLIRFDPKTGASKKFTHDPADPHSRSVTTTSVVMESADGSVWVGSWHAMGGLDRLDQASGRFQHFRHDPRNPASLLDDTIRAVFEDSRGTLWVGTEKGLNRMESDADGKLRFRTYTTRDGLATRLVTAIREDAAGNIWAGSLEGFSRLDPDSGKISNYYSADGLNSGIYNNASWLAADGTLYIGGQDGLTMIRPELLGSDTPLPAPVLTRLSVSNHLLHDGQQEENFSLDGVVSRPRALALSWREPMVSLEFSAMHYTSPDLNRYAYRLDGFDRDWVHTDAQRRVATYTNLKPGNYVFRLKAANHKGVWNEQELTFPIAIPPPFWQTWWFRLFLALLLLTALFSAYRWRTGKFKRNQLRLRKLVHESTRQLEESHAELSKAYQALLVARDEAVRASAAKSEFLANMSHEIRTPMNAIIGMTQLAMRHELEPKLRNYLEKVDGAAHWLLGILNDILDFSKIEAGKVELECSVFSVDEVVAKLRNLLGIAAREKGMMLRFVIGDGIPPLLLGDAMRLGQVLTNLLNNAIKFTEQGEVRVTIQRVTEKAGGAWLRFEVRDTGIGLSRKQCQRLFQTFTQADSSTTRKYGGTGLGLSISKRLVEMMGGEIGVESRLGAGSTFFFTARFDEVPEQTGVPPDLSQANPLGLPPDLEALRGARLLLVEDNAVNRELALELLGEAGIHADVAVNGERALAMLERADYDGVLMDCQMPVMDGFEATRKIRADARFAALPIIAMSAGVTTSDCDACRQSGMNDHIAKPIDSRVMFATLARWISVKAPQAQSTARMAENSARGEGAPTEMPRLAGVDAEEALACVNGNVALYGRLLQSFRDDQAGVVEKIRQASRDGEHKTAVRMAHTLRGLAGNVGAASLAKLAGELETALKDQQRERAEALLDVLAAPLDALIGEIDRVLPQAQSVAENPPAAANDGQTEPLYGQESRPVLLLADDVPQNVELLREALGADYHYQVAADGESVLRLAGSPSKPDIILLDVMMPGMSGYEVCQKLKENPETQAIPVVFVTALGNAVEEEKGLSLGAVDFISKPISPPVVRARVRNLLNLKRKADLLESQAFFDALTNIPNRRSFDEALHSEWLRAQRTTRPLAIIMMDIDHFKAYNDCYGHGAGDVCLKAVASALSLETVSRPADRVARLGGEEFVALLPETDERGAQLLAERLRRRVESLHIHHQQSSVSSWVTISLGYACLVPSQEHTPTHLLEEADRMLYQAKAFGRNRVYPG
jgi:diguanylate cyclase (GGDEF)-like protein